MVDNYTYSRFDKGLLSLINIEFLVKNIRKEPIYPAIAWIPGKVLPSRSSKSAPPPVLIKDMEEAKSN